ncbi:MAG: SpoIIE family protein phosphatase [Phycisphaerales bacterium]
MRLYWKILLVLVLTASVPAIVIGLVNRSTTARMGQELTEKVQRELTSSAASTFEQIQVLAASRLTADTRGVERAAARQAEAMRRVVDAYAADRAGPQIRLSAEQATRVVSATWFDDPVLRPTSARPSQRHFDAGGQPIWISEQLVAVTSAPFTPDPVTAAVVRSIASQDVADVFAAAHDFAPEAMRWQYATLDVGVHAVWPAHGGYPGDYDGRTRPWYVAQVNADGPRWHEPEIDVTTGEAFTVRTEPLIDASGTFRGIVAIDVPLGDMVAELPLPAAWGDNAMLAVCSRTAEGSLRVLAVRGGGGDVAPGDPLPIDSNSAGAIEVRDGLALGRRGVVDLPWLGGEALVGYAPLDAGGGAAGSRGSLSLVMFVPHDLVFAAADEARTAVASTVARQVRIGTLALGSLLLVVALCAVAASRWMVRPVHELAGAAGRLASGDLEARAKVVRRDELGDLASAFNEMVPRLADHVQVRESLVLAREMQQALIPKAPPTVAGVEVCARAEYCDETGGDCYDAIPTESGGAWLLVGDVTGHGVAAALMMSTARALIRAGAELGEAVETILAAADRRLFEDTPRSKFMSLFFLDLEPNGQPIRWVSAGHDPVQFVAAGSGTVEEIDGEDMLLGIGGDQEFTVLQRPGLAPGDVLFIATDGVWEQVDEAGEQFGKERMERLLLEYCARPDVTAEHIADEMLAAVHAWRGRVGQADDITILVVRGVPTEGA